MKHYTGSKQNYQTERRIVILIYYRGSGRRMDFITVRGELRQDGRLLEKLSLSGI